MIPSKQMQPALKVIQALIVRARSEAYEAGAVKLAHLLDDLEFLPDLMCDECDRTDEFGIALENIAQTHPHCRHPVEQFLGRSVNDPKPRGEVH